LDSGSSQAHTRWVPAVVCVEDRIFGSIRVKEVKVGEIFHHVWQAALLESLYCVGFEVTHFIS